ncbi:MAG: hypothetical protein U1F71_19230 [Verrucomicrobiaceae bacterium]
MKYTVEVLALGQNKKLCITEAQFVEIRDSKRNLSELLRLAECYGVLLRSYRAIEKVKHDKELDHVLYSSFGYDEILRVRMDLSAALIGYLASARLFLDSSPKLLKKLGREDLKQRFQELSSTIYDSSADYRFIEALRNYVQHRGLPIHGLVYHNFLEESKLENSDLVSALTISASKDELISDDKFKSSALVDMPDSINLIACARGHMEGLWGLYDFINKQTNEIGVKSRETIRILRDQFVRETGETPLGLHALALDDADHISEEIPMLLDWDDSRLNILKTFGSLKRLPKRYITGKIQKAKQK